MTISEMWWAAGPFTVLLDKHASIWSYRTRNGVGGSSGSTHRGSLAMAQCIALRFMPIGTRYRLLVAHLRKCADQENAEAAALWPA